MAEGEVSFKLKADESDFTSAFDKSTRKVKDFDRATDKAKTSTKNLGKQTGGINKLKGAFVGLSGIVSGLAIGAAFRKMVSATSAQQAALAQLNATLTSTEGAAGKSALELTNTASALQEITTYGDESIIQMQSLLLTFKEIKGDNFDRTSKAVLDMATAMGTDLKSAAIQLGKALNDPATQLSALSRSGVTFSEAQKAMVKEMVAAGDVAGAQTLILEELETQFGGSAEAARDTFGGALAGLENAWGDLFEMSTKSTTGMVKNINRLEKAISSKDFRDSLSLFADTLGLIVDAMDGIAKYSGIDMFGDAIAGIIAGARELGLITDDLDELGEKLTETSILVPKLSEIVVTAERRQSALESSVNNTSSALVALEDITVTATRITSTFADATEDAADSLDDASESADDFTSSANDVDFASSGVASNIVDDWGGVAGVIGSVFDEIAENGTDAFGNILEDFESMITNMAVEAARAEAIEFGTGLAQSGASFFGSDGKGDSGEVVGSEEGAAGGSLLSSAGWAAAIVGIYRTIDDLKNGAYDFSDVLTGEGVFRKYEDEIDDIIPGLGSFITDRGEDVRRGANYSSFGLFDKIFGSGGSSNAGAKGTVDLANNRFTADGVGNSFSSKNVDSLEEINKMLLEIGNEIGGSTAVFETWLGRADGLRLTDSEGNRVIETKNQTDFFEAAIDLIVEGSTALSDNLKDLVINFRGTNEETLAYAQSLAQISGTTGVNTITRSIENFTSVQPTLLSAFTDQVAGIMSLIDSYDDSVESTEQLSLALANNKVAAYDFATAIQSIGVAIGQAAESQAEYFRESVLTTEQLREKRLAERDELNDALQRGTIVDPVEIQETVSRILQLNRSAFDTLSEEQRLGSSETFATFAEQTASTAEGLLDNLLSITEESQADINQRAGEMLLSAGGQQEIASTNQIAAGEVQLEAAELQRDNANRLQAILDAMENGDRSSTNAQNEEVDA